MIETESPAGDSGKDALYAPPESEVAVGSTDNLFATFVGEKNTEFYLQRFSQFERGGGSVSWHWPAFFVTSYWLLYRKMWLLALGYIFAVPFLFQLIDMLVSSVVAPDLAGVTYLLLYVVFGFIVMPMYANKLYYQHASGKIEKIKNRGGSDAETRDRVARRGGTSLVFIVLFVLVFVIGVLAAIAITAYQDYTTRAQVSEGLTLSSAPKAAVNGFYSDNGRLPDSNADAGLPAPSELYGNYVESIEVYEGNIYVTYGNNANALIQGSMLVLQSRVANDALVWTCFSDSMPPKVLPPACRP